MAKCITERQANAYLEHLSSKGVIILDTDYIQTWTGWDSMTARSKKARAKTFVDLIANNLKHVKTGTTVFCLLNLVVSKASDKHAMCLGITQMKDKVVFEIFDPNGELSTVGWEGYVRNLVTLIADIYSDTNKVVVDVKDVRKGKNNLNTVGEGNCNALVLLYISLRSENSLTQTNRQLDKSKMNLQRLSNINKTIQKKGSF